MGIIRGTLAILFIIGNTVVACLPLFALALVRTLSARRFRERINCHLDAIIDYWVSGNRWLLQRLGITRIHAHWEHADHLSPERWYLVIANHQTWADIFVLQTQLVHRVPPLRFFTKQQLIWVPFLGLAMWCLGFPYLRRGRNGGGLSDRERIQTAAAAFHNRPSTALSFLEGTRFTPAKHAAGSGRFRHLLDPKLGGLGYLLQGMAGQLTEAVDVTIEYPAGPPSFWAFLKGECQEVLVRFQVRPIPRGIQQDPASPAGREALADWIEQIWQEKDAWLESQR